VIKAKVLSGIDSAQTCFPLRSREAGKVPRDSRHDLGCYIEGEPVSEIKCEDRCGGATGGTVSAGIGGIRRGFGRQRQPIGIGELRRSHTNTVAQHYDHSAKPARQFGASAIPSHRWRRQENRKQAVLPWSCWSRTLGSRCTSILYCLDCGTASIKLCGAIVATIPATLRPAAVSSVQNSARVRSRPELMASMFKSRILPKCIESFPGRQFPAKVAASSANR
jgi:hypothetical protein